MTGIAISASCATLRAILVALGVVTALLGALMCTMQRHVKRLLAFSTISHVGIFVTALALLTH
jgi:multicomponent Na+:H+ antiporter subunit D